MCSNTTLFVSEPLLWAQSDKFNSVRFVFESMKRVQSLEQIRSLNQDIRAVRNAAFFNAWNHMLVLAYGLRLHIYLWQLALPDVLVACI